MRPVNRLLLGLLLLVTAICACRQPAFNTTVEVIDSSGAPVAGAEVFLAKQNPVTSFELQGSTDAAGRFVFASGLASGDQLFARRRVYEHSSWRPDHGPGSGWVERVYQTSRVVNDNGSVTDLTVTNPLGTQTLTVSPNNALIGWHLVASLDWDASDDELKELVTRFTNASQYLYDLTDGQFVIEQVEIADDAQLWGSSEISFQVDQGVWPHSNAIGGFLGRAGAIDAHIYMSPFSESGFSKNPHRLIHELGHLALGLLDEYTGLNPSGNFCTGARNSATGDPTFHNGGDRAACAMDADNLTRKLCSAHNDSAHRGGSWQAGPCWNTVVATFRDSRPGIAAKDSWIIRTPDTRGAVVGKLPTLPLGLQPKITPMNKKYHDLCKPFKFVDPPAANGTVWVEPGFWGGNFRVGRLDTNGELTVHGAHLGDKIRTSHSVVNVTSAMCSITQ